MDSESRIRGLGGSLAFPLALEIIEMKTFLFFRKVDFVIGLCCLDEYICTELMGVPFLKWSLKMDRQTTLDPNYDSVPYFL